MLFKLGWDRVEGTYLDSKFVERKWEAGSEMLFEINDYLVEVAGSDGEPVRLVIRDRAAFLRLPAPGSPVPLRVNRKRTKAAFDRRGTSLDPAVALHERDEAQRAADEARWNSRKP
jgi:hypothetical protein